MSRTPANRPTVVELEAPFKTATRANSTSNVHSLPTPVAAPKAAAPKVAAPANHRKRNLWLSIAATLLIAIAGWMRFADTTQAPAQPTIAAAPAPVVAPKVPATPEPVVTEEPIQLVQAPEPTASAVVYEVKPAVPQDISDKIRDPVDVTLRVLVDASGDVMGSMMENPGRNKSLAKLADNAAREWKFAETQQEDPRVWLLRFEFTRDGVTASATEQ